MSPPGTPKHPGNASTAVHVVVHDDGTFRIPQVDTAIDCGRYVNPEGVRKQIEGAAIYGNTVAQFGKITTARGAVVQSNFHDYPVTRMNNAPLDVRVHIVEDYVHLRPCGVGEPGVPPYCPRAGERHLRRYRKADPGSPDR